MRLKKFQIKNYKSIKSFEPCWVDGVTILAGKNESGKTAVLEALRDFDRNVDEISQSAYPLEFMEETPEITLSLWFDLSHDELASLSENSGIVFDNIAQEYIKKNGLNILKETSGEYWIAEELQEILDRSAATKSKTLIKDAIERIESLRKIDGRLQSIPAVVDASTLISAVGNIEKAMVVTEGKAPFSEEAKLLTKAIKEASAIVTSMTDYVRIIEEFNYPRFVLFDTFAGKLPYQVPLAEVEKHPAIVDFIKVAGIDIKQVRDTTDEQRRNNLLRGKSATISGDFKNFWHQDTIELTARVTSDTFVISVSEGGKTTEYKPEQRSKGFQWFLSFYLRLRAENIEDEAAVILIDEPDQHLHASAQQNILEVLETIAEKSQVIFSTHSPYLLDPAKLGRVKLVTKDLKGKGEGTVVSNKIHKDADTDTLKPIITALGLDIAKDTRLVRENNVILEGMSDYYYLHAMGLMLNPKLLENVSLMPSIGASQTHLLASALIGWNLGFIVVLDNDKEGKRAEKTLKEDLLIAPAKIIKVLDKDGMAIEDLFSPGDFKKYILCDDAPSVADKSNSELVKSADKVLKAKAFLDSVHKQKAAITLSDKTKNNFLDLFKRIQESLGVSTQEEKKAGERASADAAAAVVASGAAAPGK